MGLLQPHWDTIWAAKCARIQRDASVIQSNPSYQRQRWATPDNDFVDVDYIHTESTARPLLVLFHGLEGSSQSHYAKAFAWYAQSQKMGFCVPHFRGCSGEINLAPRAYHSGDWEEIDWLLRRIKSQHTGDVYAIGVSLGGNALMRWAGEMGEQTRRVVKGIASICSPLDLMASGHHLGKGLNRYIYTPMFLRSMKPNALRKLAQYPGLFDKAAMLASRDLYEFDNVVTAPLHGFRDTKDYWTRASAKPHMANIRIPALAINALNDPFIPPSSLPKVQEVSSYVRLWQPSRGGHVGFASDVLRDFPGHLETLPRFVGQFFETGDLPSG
jgi:hypothetical protein